MDLSIKDRIRKRTYACPQQDEFYRIDDDGGKVSGHYNEDGYFIVNVEMRNAPGRCDKDGFMLDKHGKRITDDVIRDRLRVRAQLYPQEDERYAQDAKGETVNGRYTSRGYFLVDESDRRN